MSMKRISQEELCNYIEKGFNSNDYNYCTKMDLSSFDLSGLNFNLICELNDHNGKIVTFRPKVFPRGTKFINANLSNCVFSGIDLSGCDFTGANLTGAMLGACNLTDATFTCANLTGAYMECAFVKKADAHGITSFAYANLDKAIMIRTDFNLERSKDEDIYIDMEGVNFGDAYLKDIRWDGIKIGNDGKFVFKDSLFVYTSGALPIPFSNEYRALYNYNVRTQKGYKAIS